MSEDHKDTKNLPIEFREICTNCGWPFKHYLIELDDEWTGWFEKLKSIVFSQPCRSHRFSFEELGQPPKDTGCTNNIFRVEYRGNIISKEDGALRPGWIKTKSIVDRNPLVSESERIKTVEE